MNIIRNKRIHRTLTVLLGTFVGLIILESIVRGSLTLAFVWIGDSFGAFIINYLLCISILLILVSVIPNFIVGFSLYLLLMSLFGLIQKYKMNFLEEPFFPWDFIFAKQILNLLPGMYKEINFIYLLFLAVLLIASIKFRKSVLAVRISLLERGVVFFFSVCIIISFCLWDKIPLSKSVLNKMNIVNINWEQTLNYKENGSLLGFVLNVPNAIVVPPANYNKENILQIVNSINSPTSSTIYNAMEEAPNIIYIMNEAFWDPTISKNIDFSENPLSFYNSLKDSSTTGWLLSPQFGGGTSNVEFEALTGLSMRFLPQGSMPYQQYIKRPYPSLADVLKKSGYQTIALHSYVKWFWNRDNVYRHFNFDKFIGEDDFVNPERRGVYIADIEVSKRIIEEIHGSEKPTFIYAITMQNHSAYNKESKYPSEIEITGEIREKTKEVLEIYSQGVKDADEALKYLIDNINEPTIVVFFGDHLPNLGSDVYQDLDFGEDEGLEQQKYLKSTPLLIWNNLGKSIDTHLDGISPSLLLPKVFQLANLQPPLFYDFLHELNQEYIGLSKDLMIKSNGELLNEVEVGKEDILDKYELLEYDLLFGDKFSEENLFKQ